MKEKEVYIVHIKNCLKQFLREHRPPKEEKKLVEEIMQKVLELQDICRKGQ